MSVKKTNIQKNELNVSTNDIVKPKRGRKSKKEILELLNIQNNTNNNIINLNFQNLNSSNDSNITLQINETKKNNDKNTDENNDENNNELKNSSNDTNDLQKPTAKKRGRKPKGGKIISNKIEFEDKKQEKMNIILHLKCSTKDLLCKNDTYMIYPYSKNDNTTRNDELNIIGNLDIHNINLNQNSNENKSIDYYNNNINTTILNGTTNIALNSENVTNVYDNNYEYESDENSELDYDDTCSSNNNLLYRNKEIHRKIRALENNLHHNSIPNKRCCCFWDTCEFDNPPVYLIKSIINGVYSVYGCFCSTECACAYLFEEKIDSSVKFERYQLLNNTYGKIYNYSKNIRPAPNPYYMLSKYYGNLTIPEYRNLLSNDRLFLVLDKPVTKIFPELHEDNDEFLLNSKIIPSNNTGNNIKNKLQKKKPSKNLIVNEKFGLNPHQVISII